MDTVSVTAYSVGEMENLIDQVIKAISENRPNIKGIFVAMIEEMPTDKPEEFVMGVNIRNALLIERDIRLLEDVLTQWIAAAKQQQYLWETKLEGKPS